MQWLKYFPNLGNFFKKLIIKRIESLTIVQVARCKSLGFIKRILSCHLHINQPNDPVSHYHQEDKAERREGFRPPWEAGDLADDFDFLDHWDRIDADGADGVADKLVLVFATDLLKIHGVGFLIRRLPAVDVDAVVGGLADV